MYRQWGLMCGRHRARGAGAGPAPVTCASSRTALRGVRTRVTRDLISFSAVLVLLVILGLASGQRHLGVFVLLIGDWSGRHK
jgi:hypothetical protein